MDTAQESSAEKAKTLSIPGDPLCQDLLPLAEWIQAQEEGDNKEYCPPCDLATIAPWYRDLLEKTGYGELAARVQALAEGEHDVLEVAQVLDEVREAVSDEETGRELLLYNCMMQKYEEGEEV